MNFEEDGTGELSFKAVSCSPPKASINILSAVYTWKDSSRQFDLVLGTTPSLPAPCNPVRVVSETRLNPPIEFSRDAALTVVKLATQSTTKSRSALSHQKPLALSPAHSTWSPTAGPPRGETRG